MLHSAADLQLRGQALDAAWESLRDRTEHPRQAFDALAAQAQVHAVSVDGRIVGAILTIGPEIHACIKPEGFGRWLHRPALRLLRSLVSFYGRATTHATTPEGADFVTRLGFKPAGDHFELRGAYGF